MQERYGRLFLFRFRLRTHTILFGPFPLNPGNILTVKNKNKFHSILTQDVNFHTKMLVF